MRVLKAPNNDARGYADVLDDNDCICLSTSVNEHLRVCVTIRLGLPGEIGFSIAVCQNTAKHYRNIGCASGLWSWD